jgi:YD repeat-containing protein
LSGANQNVCVDSDNSHTCNGTEFVWVYDEYGNLLDDGTNTYTYDATNRLSSISNTSDTTTYTYNGDGDRISQSVNGTLTTYCDC